MKKIMVVDNEPDIVDLTRTVLELGGYTTVVKKRYENLRKRKSIWFSLIL
jgi:CheY-like chemotaxis protein